MKTPEEQFENELKIFGHEIDICLRFLYTYDTIHTVAARERIIYREILNCTPFFWRTVDHALLSSYFIALHRIFDKKRSRHHVTKVLQVAQDNIAIFSRDSLAERKRRSSANAAEWIDDFMKGVYVPFEKDLKRLSTHVEKYRKIFEKKYEPIRHRIFAHKGVSDRDESEKLFQKTDIREMQKLSMFLLRLHNTLWQLFHNGRKPVLRKTPFSTIGILGRVEKKQISNSIEDVVVADTEKLLTHLKKLGQFVI